ncbi:7-carboxy-7-deazaguanine synthase [Thioalkalivibrio versutus]|uniref:7-carboxy-7-deazaguanine synthase n=1 Tax=Thioalkalivibrio versutus TaxID=106634 RepID=A0A0G3GAB4_9GAMM|nr:7-carboxy-7-deazaguanine synthase QueE [Thioalkalivibrio versutus]AKJ95736.1 7-carboxy-7-deazaguanine synthase [Thioalkalivibrio versutus]
MTTDTLRDARGAGVIDPAAVRLRITEMFVSLQGEAAQVGWPTAFVRLTGCPLRCRWCDSEYAFEGGEALMLATILDWVGRAGVRHVCVTGGEPLAQPGCLPLLEGLCDAGFSVSLETSGAMEIAGVDPRVAIVMDWKAPASQEAARNRPENIPRLKAGDQLKFVLAGREDFDWARAELERLGLAPEVEVLFSPVYDELEPRALADWIIAERLPVRFQVQLHKLLWGDQPGR